MTPSPFKEATGSIALVGAPDKSIGDPNAATSATQAFCVQLVQGLTKEMKDHIRHGKAHVVLGSNAHIRIGNSHIPIEYRRSDVRKEIYAKTGIRSEELEYRGLVSHDFVQKKVKGVTAGANAAELKLREDLASLQQKKEDSKVHSINAAVPARNTPSSLKNLGVFSNRAPSRSPLPHAAPYSPRPIASSGAIATTPQGRADVSGALAKTAQRFVLIHTLAIKPLNETEILNRTKIPRGECLALLQKIGSRSSTNEWQLTDRSYKELDPYRFDFTVQGERESAIDNAARAFDRLRVSKEDKLWDRLNAPSERGKGKVLSKLNLTGPAVSTPIANRLSTKSSSPGTETVAGLLSADESARPQSSSSHKIGAVAAERSKRLLSKKPLKPVPPKSARAEIVQTATRAADSEIDDMAKKGVAVRVSAGQKRKAEAAKYKSAERIEDSDIDDDDLKVKEPAPKRVKTEPESARSAQPAAKAAAKPAAKVAPPVRTKAQSDNEKSAATTKASLTEPKSSPSLAATSMKKSSGLFGNVGATSANAAKNKIRKVSRMASVNGATSETDKAKPIPSAAQQRKAQPELAQKQKQTGQNATPKNKGSALAKEKEQVKGLPPSSSLPPKPPKSINPASTNLRHNASLQSERKVSQNNKGRPNAVPSSSASGGKQTPEINVHKRMNSASTISSTTSTAVPAVFTPTTHRNSTSSSQSTSSMVSTRSETRNQNLKRPAADNDKAPPAKKLQTEKPHAHASSTNSSPLTAVSDLGSISTPAQTTLEHDSTQQSQVANIEALSQPPQPTAIDSGRARLSSMRSQYTHLFSSFVDSKVAYLKAAEADEPFGDATYNDLVRCSEKVKAMEADIKALMLEVQDWTWWDGVPASFKTPHEAFLRERLRKMHIQYQELYEQYSREKWPEGTTTDLRKMLVEMEGLRKILHPDKEWEFVADQSTEA